MTWIVVAAAVGALALAGAIASLRRTATGRAPCPGCGRALLPSWTRCPFCGLRPPGDRPRFEITGGPLRGQTIEIGDELRVGSVAGNDVVLADPAVSREHFVVRREAGDYQLVDLDSSNGVYVNGRGCRRARLAPGDTIVVGNSELRFLR